MHSYTIRTFKPAGTLAAEYAVECASRAEAQQIMHDLRSHDFDEYEIWSGDQCAIRGNRADGGVTKVL